MAFVIRLSMTNAPHAWGNRRIHSEKRHCNPVDAANESQHDVKTSARKVMLIPWVKFRA